MGNVRDVKNVQDTQKVKEHIYGYSDKDYAKFKNMDGLCY